MITAHSNVRINALLAGGLSLPLVGSSFDMSIMMEMV